ncbi:MAG: isopentenyl-diphosphate Delta-isomerase [Flavobacteriales bacterium]
MTAAVQEESVVLVDEQDNAIGAMGKMEVHRSGLLHRAFSVFVFNEKGQLLLQRRAPGKYHSAGLWTNTCCGHPRPGEDLQGAAQRRLMEEMGIACALERNFSFTYTADVGNGLRENELDHVFSGSYSGDPHPDPEEADAWRAIALDALELEMAREPHRFTPWLHHCVSRVAGRDRPTAA